MSTPHHDDDERAEAAEREQAKSLETLRLSAEATGFLESAHRLCVLLTAGLHGSGDPAGPEVVGIYLSHARRCTRLALRALDSFFRDASEPATAREKQRLKPLRSVVEHPERVQDVLALADEEVPISEIAGWTLEQREQAVAWAGAAFLGERRPVDLTREVRL